MNKPFLLNLILSACLLFHAHPLAAQAPTDQVRAGQVRLAMMDFPTCPDSSRISACIDSFMLNGDSGRVDSAIYFARKLDTICLRQMVSSFLAK